MLLCEPGMLPNLGKPRRGALRCTQAYGLAGVPVSIRCWGMPTAGDGGNLGEKEPVLL